jgi:hypothetical protein
VDPHGLVKLTVKSPRLLLLEVMVKTADPPGVMVCCAGVTVKFGGLDTMDTVPLPPPLKVIVTGREPPFLEIDIEVSLIVGKHGTGVGSGVGDAVGVGFGVGDAVGDGSGVGDAVGDGSGVGVAVGDGFGVGVAVGVGDGVGVGVAVGEAFGSGWSITPSPDTFAFKLTFGISSS